MQGIARFKYDGREEEEEERVWSKPLMKAEVLARDLRDEGVVEDANYEP